MFQFLFDFKLVMSTIENAIVISKKVNLLEFD